LFASKIVSEIFFHEKYLGKKNCFLSYHTLAFIHHVCVYIKAKAYQGHGDCSAGKNPTTFLTMKQFVMHCAKTERAT